MHTKKEGVFCMKKIYIFMMLFQVVFSIHAIPGLIRDIFPIQETWIKNSRFAKIYVIITHKNKETTWYALAPGHIQKIPHTSDDFKKIVISQTHQTNITLSASDLKTYAVFICNPDNKVEKYHFIDKHQKRTAKKYADDTKNILLQEEVGDMSIYLL